LGWGRPRLLCGGPSGPWGNGEAKAWATAGSFAALRNDKQKSKGNGKDNSKGNGKDNSKGNSKDKGKDKGNGKDKSNGKDKMQMRNAGILRCAQKGKQQQELGKGVHSHLSDDKAVAKMGHPNACGTEKNGDALMASIRASRGMLPNACGTEKNGNALMASIRAGRGMLPNACGTEKDGDGSGTRGFS